MRRISALLSTIMIICCLGSAVFANDTTAVTDELTRESTGITGTNYGVWSGVEGTSGAEYAGNSAGDYNSIQLRFNNGNSGIITTKSAGCVTKIQIDWNSDHTEEGRTLRIYGKNTPYSSASDLYSTEE